MVKEKEGQSLKSPFGIVAGSGRLPLELAQSAKNRGLKLALAAHKGESSAELEKLSDFCQWVRVGQLGRMLRFFSAAGVKQVVFGGAISRRKLFNAVHLDWRGAALIARVGSIKDDAILRGVIEEFERRGIEVLPAAVLLEQSIPKSGLLSLKDFSKLEWRDALIGWDAAKALGALDVGQTAVVGDGLVIALEAVEGTDAVIARAGELTRRAEKIKKRGVFSKTPPGLVVVKVCKPIQDQRVDLPTVGAATVQNMHAAGATALLVEAGKTIIVDPQSMLNEANRLGIAVRAAARREEIVEIRDRPQF